MQLNGKRVAILVENLYEDLELWYPYYRLKEEGAEVTLVGSRSGEVYKSKHGYEAKPNTTVNEVDSSHFDAIVIPGGFAPDYMRRNKLMVQFVKDVYERGKLVAAICHAGWMLISAGIVKGKRATCFHSIKDDMINAGATYVDEEIVRDGNLVTSRFPADLPAFCREIITVLREHKVPVVGEAVGS